MLLTLYTSIPLILPGISGSELMVILLVILMLFGSDKIPEMAKGLARIINQVKNASNELKSEITKGVENNEVIKEINEVVNVEEMKKRIGLDDMKKTIDDVNPIQDVQQEIEKAKEDIESMTGPIKRMK